VTLSLVQAIPEVEHRIGKPITLVGGLAVLARLGSAAHRVTTDVDTVDLRAAGARGQLEILLDSGATAIDGAGAMVATPAGEVRVDVLEIGEQEVEDLPEDPTDRLYVLSHDWAMRTATSLLLRATDGATTVEHPVQVAEAGPLIATKLQALPNRSLDKEATDLLDIVRLTLDEVTGPVVRKQLAEADPQLRQDAALHIRTWFADNAARSVRIVHRTPDGAGLSLDIVRLTGELLTASLRL
jgi:hypothetical protein